MTVKLFPYCGPISSALQLWRHQVSHILLDLDTSCYSVKQYLSVLIYLIGLGLFLVHLPFFKRA